MSKKVGEIRFNLCSHQCNNIEGRSDYGFGIDCIPFDWHDLASCGICHEHGKINSKHECICDDGYVGTHCEFENCDLANGKCLNGGKCLNTPPDDWKEGVDPFICDCSSFYHGQHCQTYFCTDENDCLNGGVCSKESEGCDCSDGFSGMQCEFKN